MRVCVCGFFKYMRVTCDLGRHVNPAKNSKDFHKSNRFQFILDFYHNLNQFTNSDRSGESRLRSSTYTIQISVCLSLICFLFSSTMTGHSLITFSRNTQIHIGHQLKGCP